MAEERSKRLWQVFLVIAIVIVAGAMGYYLSGAKARAPEVAAIPAEPEAAATSTLVPREPTPAGYTEEVTQEGTCQRLPDYDRSPQPQIGHPSVYVETGVNDKTRCWIVPVKEGFVAIVGGFKVDGISNGVYRAIPGPDTATVEVTDGFALVVVEEVAREEFCFRVGQAVEYGWAHQTVEPLPSWAACEAPVAEPTATPTPVAEPTATPTPVVKCERRATEQNQTLRFAKGEAVYGWRIQLDNGRLCDDGECYLPSAPVGGEVTSGVICPWAAEVESVTPWVPSPS